MKKIIIPILLLFSMAINTNAQNDKELVKTGQQAPGFSVKMFDGTTIDIDQLRGKVVLINFWATWCPPCRQELTRVQKEIIDRFKGKDFVFLPISREDSYEKIKVFREQNKYTFPMGMDTDRKIFSLFALETIPRNYLIDKKGKIVFMETGYSEESFEKLIGEIEKTLK